MELFVVGSDRTYNLGYLYEMGISFDPLTVNYMESQHSVLLINKISIPTLEELFQLFFTKHSSKVSSKLDIQHF